jgi:hypothetical protein
MPEMVKIWENGQNFATFRVNKMFSQTHLRHFRWLPDGAGIINYQFKKKKKKKNGAGRPLLKMPRRNTTFVAKPPKRTFQCHDVRRYVKIGDTF